jgi:hypothetical protein
MRHFVFLAYAQRKLNTLKRTLSLICRNCKKRQNFKLTLSVRKIFFSVS